MNQYWKNLAIFLQKQEFKLQSALEKGKKFDAILWRLHVVPCIENVALYCILKMSFNRRNRAEKKIHCVTEQ